MVPTSELPDEDARRTTDIVEPHTPASFSASAEALFAPDRIEWLGEDRARILRGSSARMTLEIAHGVSELQIVGAGAGEDLATVRFAGQRPRITVHDDVVRVSHGRQASVLTWLTDLLVHGVHGPTRVTLGKSTSWRLHITAGAAELNADLSDVLLEEVAISGGANDLELKGRPDFNSRGRVERLH
jgi:hypothetical protein